MYKRISIRLSADFSAETFVPSKVLSILLYILSFIAPMSSSSNWPLGDHQKTIRRSVWGEEESWDLATWLLFCWTMAAPSKEFWVLLNYYNSFFFLLQTRGWQVLPDAAKPGICYHSLTVFINPICRASFVAQLAKNPFAMQETWV